MKPTWMEIAENEIGVTEIEGKEHNPRIIEYHQITSLKATTDEIPWCAALVCWVLEQAGIKSTKSAAARSYLNWGTVLKQPKAGCIVVFERGNNGWSGHVGFYIGETENSIAIIGGNQSNSVSIGYYPKNKVLGYRWP